VVLDKVYQVQAFLKSLGLLVEKWFGFQKFFSGGWVSEKLFFFMIFFILKHEK